MDAGPCGAVTLQYREAIASSSLGGESDKWTTSDVPHWLNEHEFEQTPGDSEGQRRLVHDWSMDYRRAAVHELIVWHNLATE